MTSRSDTTEAQTPLCAAHTPPKLRTVETTRSKGSNGDS